MDCKQMLAILATAFVALPALAQGTEHIVGDHYGWTLNFNYSAWAEGKEFRVGDTLVFKYAYGAHNVFKVSGSAFEQCGVPPESEAMATGNDVITLATPGKKWYICGKAQGKHCWSGMRLVVDVLPPPSTEHPPTAAPATPSGPRKFYVGDDSGWTLNFDYMAWARGKEFRVGDILVFNYPVGVHNVFKLADGPSFQACKVPHESEAMTTGNDMITLATPGRKWYICGKAAGKHCQMGQKLVVDVLPSASVPAPSSDAPSISPSAPMPGSKEFIVGDDYGWTLNFDYAAWAQGKEFRVGDKLVFKYGMGKHNVFKVDGPAFMACSVPPRDEALTTGHDVITLATAGRKWYICGKAHGKHCQMGQKLFINVLPAAAGLAPAESPPSGYTPSPHHQYGRRLLK